MKQQRRTQKRYGGACGNSFTCNALKQQYKLNRTEQSKKQYEGHCVSCTKGGRRVRRTHRRRHTSHRR